MNKNIVQWVLGLSAYIALGLFGFMLYPSVIHTRFYFSSIIGSAIIDSIAFFVVCASLRKFKEFLFWKLAVYLTLIAAPSPIIASIKTDLTHAMYYSVARYFVLWPNIPLDLHFFLVFCAFVLFASLNFVLWRALFSITIRQAFCVSLLVGFINTIICCLSTPIYK